MYNVLIGCGCKQKCTPDSENQLTSYACSYPLSSWSDVLTCIAIIGHECVSSFVAGSTVSNITICWYRHNASAVSIGLQKTL